METVQLYTTARHAIYLQIMATSLIKCICNNLSILIDHLGEKLFTYIFIAITDETGDGVLK
jgi:hypothetical protein